MPSLIKATGLILFIKGAFSAMMIFMLETIIPARKDNNRDMPIPKPSFVSMSALLLAPITMPRLTPVTDPMATISNNWGILLEKSTPKTLLKISIVNRAMKKFSKNPTLIDAKRLILLLSGDMAFLFAIVVKFASYW